jgi:hypothetical protein
MKKDLREEEIKLPCRNNMVRKRPQKIQYVNYCPNRPTGGFTAIQACRITVFWITHLAVRNK